MKNDSNDLKKPSTPINAEKPTKEFEKLSKEKLSTDHTVVKVISDEFEFDTSPFTAFEDLTGTIKNEG